MKKFLMIFVFVIANITLNAQTFTVFDVDDSNYPTMRAKFFAFDKDGQLLTDLSPSDFEISENGEFCTVTNITCPTPQPPAALSSVLVMDASGSMGGRNLTLAKEAAKAWINASFLGRSECAITAFDNSNYLIQDFTTDKTKLLEKVECLGAGGGTDYNAALINRMSGGLLISKAGQYKRVIVFLSDGYPNQNPAVTTIIAEANKQNATIFSVTLDMICPQSMRRMAWYTGGEWFENITTVEQAKEVYNQILQIAQGDGEPCEIEWEGIPSCTVGKDVEITCIPISKTSEINYTINQANIAKLDVTPKSIKIGEIGVGTSKDTIITVTAINSDFECTDIISNNPDFDINPKQFSLDAGNSRELTITYTPKDNVYSFARFKLESSPCENYIYAVAGFINIASQKKSIKLTHPNGGETFVVGSDSVITWTGVLPTDTVSLSYSFDKGKTWNMLTDSAVGLTQEWNNIPQPVSDSCLMCVEKENEFASELKWSTLSINGEAVAFNPDGSILAFSGCGTITLASSVTGDIIRTLRYKKGGGEVEEVNSLSFSPDGSMLAVASVNGTVNIWDIGTGAVLRTLSHGSSHFYSLSFSPDGSMLAVGGMHTVTLREVSTGSKIRTITGSSYFYSLSFSPDGKMFASGHNDGTIKLWDIVTGSEIRTITGYSERVNSLSFSPDGKMLTSAASNKGIVKLFDVATGSEIRTITGSSNFNSLSFSPDGKMLATGYNRTATLWNVATGSEVRTITGNRFIHSLSFSPDGSMLATGRVNSNFGSGKFNEGVVQLREVSTGNLIHTLTGYRYRVNSLSISSDGSMLAMGGYKTVNLFDVATGNEIHTLNGHSGYVHNVAFSPDGSKIASTSDGAEGKLWDVATGNLIYPFTGGSLSFSPDGSMLASGSGIFEVSTGNLIRWFNENFLIFSPDGSMLASGGYGTVKLWDVSTEPVSDISDKVWSIVMPIAEAQDIDMGKILINSVKDSVVTSFIRNNGTWKCRIDSIYLQGADASVFSLVSGLPKYEIAIGKKSFGEFSFKPLEKRKYQAEIVIITQADTLIQNIIGEGIKPQLVILEKFIEFGIVNIGQNKDTLQAVTVKNIGSVPIEILSTKHNFPNDKDFTTISGGGNFTLPIGDTCKMNLNFTPSELGRTNGTLEFHYNGVGSPAIVQLFGEGVDAPKIQVQTSTIPDLICDNLSMANIEITNTGGNPLIINELNFTGTNQTEFFTNETLPISINPNSTNNITVSFYPNSTGDKTADLEIVSNAYPDSLFIIPLSARKDSVALIPTIQNIDLGYLCPNETKDTIISIVNSGTIDSDGYAVLSSNLSATLTTFSINQVGSYDFDFSFTGLPNDGLIDEMISIYDSECGYLREVKITGIIEQVEIEVSDLSVSAFISKSKTGKLIIKNLSNRKVTITSVDNISVPFSVVGNPFPLTIEALSINEIEINYTPDDEIEDNATVVFHAKPCDITNSTEIIGIPVSVMAEFKTTNHTAYPGEEINVPILLNDAENIEYSGATSYKTDLIFNPTILYPLDYNIEKINDVTAKITLENLPIDEEKGKALTNIRFIAGLGNATECDLKLSNAEAIGSDADVSMINGHFTLLGVCKEGGARLINPLGEQSGIIDMFPNPANNTINIKINLIEEGRTELLIFNSMGEIVETILSEDVNQYYTREYNTNISNLSSGLYFIVFKTPTYRQTEQLMIIR